MSTLREAVTRVADLLDRHAVFDAEDGNYRVEGETYRAAINVLADVEDALAASALPSPALDVERLKEAVWNANVTETWGEAVDTTDRMAEAIAAEYARAES